MTEQRSFYVEILDRATGRCVRQMGPMTCRKAERVENGVRINLNHAEYECRVVHEDQKSKEAKDDPSG